MPTLPAVPPLHDAIARLYAACADLPRPRRIAHCPGCLGDETLCALTTLPLQQLRSTDLRAYTASALLTCGDTPDFLYFLPRILDLELHGDSVLNRVEDFGDTLVRAGIATWPEPRRQALNTLFLSMFDSWRHAEADPYIGDEWLCALAATGLPMAPFLDRFCRIDEAFYHFMDMHPEAIQNGVITGIHWNSDSRLPGIRQIIAWFQRPDSREFLRDHYGISLPTAPDASPHPG